MSDTEIDSLGQGDLKLSFGDLTPLEKYSLKSITKSSNIFNGKVIEGLKAVVVDEDSIEFVTYLPKSFANMTEATIEKINSGFVVDKPYFVVLYGQVKLANMAKIHKNGDEIDMAYYKKVKKLGEMSACSLSVGQSSEESPKRSLSPSVAGPAPKVVKKE